MIRSLGALTSALVRNLQDEPFVVNEEPVALDKLKSQEYKHPHHPGVFDVCVQNSRTISVTYHHSDIAYKALYFNGVLHGPISWADKARAETIEACAVDGKIRGRVRFFAGKNLTHEALLDEASESHIKWAVVDGIMNKRSRFFHYQPEGFSETYSLKTKKLVKLCSYRRDVKTGPMITWFRDGTLRKCLNFIINKAHGKYVCQHANGFPAEAGRVFLDRRENPWRVWATGLKEQESAEYPVDVAGVPVDWIEDFVTHSATKDVDRPPSLIAGKRGIAGQASAFLLPLRKAQ